MRRAATFCSKEFQNLFVEKNGIKHITSPPYHPSSNGAAENSVKTVKNCIRKALGKGNSLNLNLVFVKQLSI